MLLKWTQLLLLCGSKGSGVAVRLILVNSVILLSILNCNKEKQFFCPERKVQGHNLLSYQWKPQFNLWIIHYDHCVKIPSFRVHILPVSETSRLMDIFLRLCADMKEKSNSKESTGYFRQVNDHMSQTYPNSQLEGLPPHTVCSLHFIIFFCPVLFPISLFPPLGLPSSCSRKQQQCSPHWRQSTNQSKPNRTTFCCPSF